VRAQPPWGAPDTADEVEPQPAEQTPQLGKLTPAERAEALRAPGPSWKEWAYGTALKWWLGLGLLIVDSWLVAGWIEVGGYLPLAGSLAVAVYLEYLLYQYLWHPYHPELRGKFRPSWHAPFEVGRWSPERADLLAGKFEPTAPDPRQFL